MEPAIPQTDANADTEHRARLIVKLSVQSLLRGDPSDLLREAQADPIYGPGFHEDPYVSHTGKGNVNFALLPHTDFILIIFPGSTKLLQNWASHTGNFSFRRVQQLDSKIHKGFWKQVDSFWMELERKLSRLPRALPIVLGGHSRGGACAVITAWRIRKTYELERVAAVITLGQPGCVNFNLARQIRHDLDRRYVRIVTSTDIIPLGPMRPWYAHAGVIWFYKKDGTRIENPLKDDMDEAIHKDNPVMRRPRGLIRFAGALRHQTQTVIDGHALATYRKCLFGDSTTPAVERVQPAI